MYVVLPEPDGPMMQTVSPFADVEGNALQDLEPAEALLDIDGVHDEIGHARAPVAHRERVAEALPAGERPLFALTRRQPALDPRLHERPDRCQQQVPDGDGGEVFDRLERL